MYPHSRVHWPLPDFQCRLKSEDREYLCLYGSSCGVCRWLMLPLLFRSPDWQDFHTFWLLLSSPVPSGLFFFFLAFTPFPTLCKLSLLTPSSNYLPGGGLPCFPSGNQPSQWFHHVESSQHEMDQHVCKMVIDRYRWVRARAEGPGPFSQLLPVVIFTV